MSAKMTNERAIKNLKMLRQLAEENEKYIGFYACLDIAIQALEREDVAIKKERDKEQKGFDELLKVGQELFRDATPCSEEEATELNQALAEHLKSNDQSEGYGEPLKKDDDISNRIIGNEVILEVFVHQGFEISVDNWLNRIIACVNSLAGIPTADLQGMKFSHLIDRTYMLVPDKDGEE